MIRSLVPLDEERKNMADTLQKNTKQTTRDYMARVFRAPSPTSIGVVVHGRQCVLGT